MGQAQKRKAISMTPAATTQKNTTAKIVTYRYIVQNIQVGLSSIDQRTLPIEIELYCRCQYITKNKTKTRKNSDGTNPFADTYKELQSRK